MTRPADVIDRASRDVGFVEGANNANPYGEWYGLPRQPYCAMALSRWTFDAGLPTPASTSKGYAYTPSGALWFQRRQRWGEVPRVGAHVFFRFSGQRIHHVGLVTGIHGGSIDTIEANTSRGSAGSQRDGGGVWRRRRSAGIVGYGYPDYDDGQAPDPLLPETGDESARVRELQGLYGGIDIDGEWGPKTAGAAGSHMVGWPSEVRRRGGNPGALENRPDIVRWVQIQANRRGSPQAVDGDPGPATNHAIVVVFGQIDGILGPDGFREACR
ncbi:MAG: CHAP domain-containing protein [Chloroflexota bacterium]|nr:CHAP domain-containing protein [Chloroflexota bacterium]